MSNKPENSRGTRQPEARAPDTETSTSTNTTTTTPSSSSQAEHPSLSTRIQNSATGLARGAFTGGTGDIAQTLATATDGKSGGSSSARGGQGYLASQETSAKNGSNSVGYAGSGAAAGSESFREPGTGSRPGGFALDSMTEEEFQHGGDAYTDPGHLGMSGAILGSGSGSADEAAIEGYTNPNPHPHPELDLDSLQASSGTWKGKHRAQDPVQLEYNTAWERAEQAQHLQSRAIQPTDGAAVVSLLSDASFDPNDPEEGLDLDIDAAPPPLTASEIETLDSFRRQMGSGPAGQEQPQSHGLTSTSLIPDIDTFLQQHDPATSHSRPQTQNEDTTLRDTVLSNLPGAADWIGVQERYHDEVWGYLRPALEAAKAEMEDGEKMEGIGHGGDGPAVRRLRMILEHMKI